MTLNPRSDNTILRLLDNNRLIAAPLAGITTPPFRKMLRDFHDGIIYTEMISVEGLIRMGAKTLEYLRLNDADHPVGIQLFGGKPESYPEAVRVAEECSSPDFYDINMGCPVKKVIKGGSGSALLCDLPRAGKIISALRRATDKPVTVKIRLGWDRDSLIYNELIRIAAEEGADAVTLHGRTKTEMFSGVPDYELIADAVANSSISVIGNGNVADVESMRRMEQTGCDGIMIGRGLMKMPWIFESLRNGKNPEGYLSGPQLYELLLKLYDYTEEFAEGKKFIDAYKKYSVWFSKGFHGSSDFRTRVYKCGDESSLKKCMKDFFLTSDPV
ncbi:tRNA dihydrouridine synthase [Limisalsivibrio acetivorans]|uniref:tRNA dihydrouridine synthase n=1 Tax=Limisalsivibrio acetivorans TaxID=1304888 RepID=UPI0003B7879C|nr:tRNA-dihydrouridine synthase family protein [Limisalsivibrio acetivorans]